MYKLISYKNIEITPKRAREFLRLNTFEGQRLMDADHVAHIVSVMKAGQFRIAEVAIAVRADGSELLMNSQHTLEACATSGVTLRATLSHYSVPENEDIWRLFGTFDTHKGRTEANVMKSARGLFDSAALRAVPIRVLKMCGSALVFIQDEDNPNFAWRRQSSKTFKTELVIEHETEVLLVASYGDEVTSRLQVPVISCLLLIWRKESNKAKLREFWDRVLYGDQLVKNTPQWRLVQALSGKGTAIPQGGYARNFFVACLCITWWNAFITGDDERNYVKVRAMKSLPEIITSKAKRTS